MRHLIIRHFDHRLRPSFECAIPLVGTEIVLFRSLVASDLAQWLHSLHVHGFELRTTLDDAPIMVRVQNNAVAQHWALMISSECRQVGIGYLLYAGATPKWKLLWCVLERHGVLQCYAESIHHVLGKQPFKTLVLTDAVIRPFSSGKANLNQVAQQLFESSPFGFEVEELNEGKLFAQTTASTFAAASIEGMESWLHAIGESQGSQDVKSSKSLTPTQDKFEFRPSLFATQQSFAVTFEKRSEIITEVPTMLGSIVEEGRISMAARHSILPDEFLSLPQTELLEEEDKPAQDKSDDSHECDEEVSIALLNLRRMAKLLDSKSASLHEEVRQAQEDAQTALEFFGEKVSLEDALHGLYVFFQRLVDFAVELKTALVKVKQKRPPPPGERKRRMSC